MLKYVIFSFWIVLMYPLGVDLHLTGIPQIAADLNAPESTLHTAFSVYLAGMAAMMLIAGWCAIISGAGLWHWLVPLFFVWLRWLPDPLSPPGFSSAPALPRGPVPGSAMW